MSAKSGEMPFIRKRTRPFWHARLATFFLSVAVLAALLTGWILPESGSGRRWAPLAAAVLTAAVSFSGVLVHRMRINLVRWRETEHYLDRIRHESERYRAILEGAADMLLVVDSASGVIRECNALSRQTLGLTVAEGRVRRAGGDAPGAPAKVQDLVHARGAQAIAGLLVRAQAGEEGASVAEVPLLSGKGEPLLADVRAATFRFGEEHSVLLSVRDVTRQKAIERELQTRERLSSIGLMTAGVAHDINNPLEGIANYLGLLARPGVPEETRTRYLERVVEGFERIRGLVRELLRFAGPGSPHEAVDLAAIVQRAWRMASLAPGVQQATLEVDGLDAPLFVLGDASRLEQVLFNLLTNAATAMRGQERPRIRVFAGASEDPGGPEQVLVRVADEGPGIAPADLDRIFDPFYSRTGGVGLGLSVCYGTVLAHGGTLTARNRPEGGAEFRFFLPLAVEASVPLAAEVAHVRRARHREEVE